ncbi:MAG TPA: recombinase family protein [Pantanalinema sp.]
MADGRYVAYYRVSTQGQGSSGLGLEAQQEAVVSYLNGGGWELVGKYTDVESGTRKGNDRPELKKALAHAKREKATLIIAKLDRLARNVHFITGLMESGVDFVAVDNPTATRFTVQILAVLAEEEARLISVRTKAALQAARKRGAKLGKPENLTDSARRKGAEAAGQKASRTARDEYTAIVPTIMRLRAQGLSLRAIAQHLNQAGEVTRHNKPFEAMTVQRIIKRLGPNA